MIEVTIICDHAEGARAKEGHPSNWCRTASHSTMNAPTGVHGDMDTACSLARIAARNAGWQKTKINPMGQRGYLCPPCYARAFKGATNAD